jgi:hypothetical protein
MFPFILAFLNTLLAALTPTVTAACTLQNLQDAETTYLSSVTAGFPAAALAKATYKENNKAADIINGAHLQPMKINHNKTLYDTTPRSAPTIPS